MKNLAGFIYHCNSLTLKLFPAGKHNEIDWNNIAFSDGNFDFFLLKDSGTSEKSYVEYSTESDYNINPLRLKETVRYKCQISDSDNPDKKENYKFHFKNESNKFLKTEKDDEKSIVFQFINYLGKSELCFETDNKPLALSFEVVPDKISYESDYVNLTQAIAEECSALLLEYASPTSLTFSQDAEKQQKTALEQFIFLRQFCYSDNIESLFASIKRNPDRILIEEDEFKPFGQGAPSKRFFTNPLSYGRNWNDSGSGFYLPSEIAVTHKCESLDTPANRFLKFALNVFLEICENIITYVNEPNSFYVAEAGEIKTRIENILQDSFFDDVLELTLMPVNNQVLEKREGYSQIFNAFSMVDLALQLDWKGKEEVYSGESKNTALLYEYWLFFELRKIISKIDGCLPVLQNGEDAFIKENNGLTISLCQDKKSVQHFETENQKIDLYYNRTFSHKNFEKSKYEGSYSRPFRPDYTIAIFSKEYNDEKEAVEDGAVSYIHFDAKYRLEDLSQFINKEETEEEIIKEISAEKSDSVMNTYKRGDLLKMHTYNDAIRRTVGSYVLYPGTDNKDGKRFSVYEEILPGVGAFAILPGNMNSIELNAGEKAVQEFIKEIVEFNANPASRNARTDYFDRMIAESPSDERGIASTNSCLTMIGFVRESYYEYLKEKKIIPTSSNDIECIGKEFYFYYHAIKNGNVYTLHKETMKAKYLRLTLTDYNNTKIKQGKKFENLESWRAEIISTELVSRFQLQELLSDYSDNDKFQAGFYYVAKVRIKDLYDGGIIAISTDENEIISPYFPKIVEMENL